MPNMMPPGPAQAPAQGQGLGQFGFMAPAIAGDNQREELREIDIIRAYFNQAKVPPYQMLQILQKAVTSGVTFSRKGNTVMGIKKLGGGAAQVYFFSVDQPQAASAAITQFLSELKQAGVQAVYLNKSDPTINQIMQGAGVTLQQSDRPEFKIKAVL